MKGPVKNVRQVSPSVEIQKLSFSKVLPQLKSCVREMEDAACNIRTSLQTFPSGSLRVSPHRGSYQYFHVTEGSKRNGSKGSYIPMEQIGVARGLAQKVYNEEMASALAEGASVLKSALQKFNSSRIDTCYEMQGPVRRALVAPVYLPNDVYADRWQKVEYQGKEFLEEDSLLTTAKGDRVRSKSEVIIANMLNQMNVPYRYEYPLRLSSGLVIYPDFTCLNVRTRDEFIWEHFGRMDDMDYQVKAFKKLDSLAQDGYVHGVNLIYTMENGMRPLNLKNIEQLVRAFLL